MVARLAVFALLSLASIAGANPGDMAPAHADAASAPGDEDPPAGATPAPDAPPSSTEDELRELATHIRRLGALATAFGGGSREAERLSNAANVAADWLELGALVVGANQPTSYTWHLSGAIGGGARTMPLDDRSGRGSMAGEVAVSAGVAVAGPSCALLEASARAVLATRDGPSFAHELRACSSAIQITDSEDTTMAGEMLASTAHASFGLDVRPAVDASSIADDRRYFEAEAGLYTEGIRFRWPGRWSVAGPGIGMTGALLGRDGVTERERLERVTATAWFFEGRFHRDRTQLDDMAFRLFPITLDEIVGGQDNSTVSLVPLAISGLGAYGVYVDAKGGLDITAFDPEDPPEVVDGRPNVAIGSWRLAARIGSPRMHATVANEQRLLPTLDDAVIAERRSTAALHVNVSRAYLDVRGYRASIRRYEGGGDVVDATYRTWGVQAEAWLRFGDHLIVGASIETGRSFVYAPVGATTPPFGSLVLAHVGWRTSETQALD